VLPASKHGLLPDPPALARGAVAGAAATAPMTAFMLATFRLLPPAEQYPLPPREITSQLRSRSGLLFPAAEAPAVLAAVGAHFAYGATAGMLLGGVRSRAVGAAAGHGALLGLGIWLASYLGLLPALKLQRPATEHPAGRTALMVAAHLVWGACAGALVHRLEARAQR
jgi:putative membrane protein